MRALTFRRCLSISLAAALLTACGRAPFPTGGMSSANGTASSSSGKRIFFYTGKKRAFVVPAGVTQLAVDVRGAGGADAGFKGSPSFLPPAAGGIVDASIPVKPGETLYVFVGGRGVSSGGFNGGGSAYYGGGGASDIREGGDTLQDRIVVAAGGGGSGVPNYFYYFYAGDGGGLKGSPGSGGYRGTCSGGGGRGGTQHEGGAGGHGGKAPPSGEAGNPGGKGTLGKGGDGGAKGGYYGTQGGGGGGGYYGGGGGGSGTSAYSSGFSGCGSSYDNLIGGGGGGGSSYIEPSATNGKMFTGEASARGDGRVVLRWN